MSPPKQYRDMCFNCLTTNDEDYYIDFVYFVEIKESRRRYYKIFSNSNDDSTVPNHAVCSHMCKMCTKCMFTKNEQVSPNDVIDKGIWFYVDLSHY